MIAFPKNPSERNAHYRAMAKGMECQMRVPYVCCGNPETTVLAHSNSLADNKGMGMKSHDWAGVHACYACHAWLDQGAAPAAAKDLVWRRARQRMEAALNELAASPLAKERDRNAAKWALDRIQAQRSG